MAAADAMIASAALVLGARGDKTKLLTQVTDALYQEFGKDECKAVMQAGAKRWFEQYPLAFRINSHAQGAHSVTLIGSGWQAVGSTSAATACSSEQERQRSDFRVYSSLNTANRPSPIDTQTFKREVVELLARSGEIPLGQLTYKHQKAYGYKTQFRPPASGLRAFLLSGAFSSDVEVVPWADSPNPGEFVARITAATATASGAATGTAAKLEQPPHLPWLKKPCAPPAHAIDFLTATKPLSEIGLSEFNTFCATELYPHAVVVQLVRTAGSDGIGVRLLRTRLETCLQLDKTVKTTRLAHYLRQHPAFFRMVRGVDGFADHEQVYSIDATTAPAGYNAAPAFDAAMPAWSAALLAPPDSEDEINLHRHRLLSDGCDASAPHETYEQHCLQPAGRDSRGGGGRDGRTGRGGRGGRGGDTKLQMDRAAVAPALAIVQPWLQRLHSGQQFAGGGLPKLVESTTQAQLFVSHKNVSIPYGHLAPPLVPLDSPLPSALPQRTPLRAVSACTMLGRRSSMFGRQAR